VDGSEHALCAARLAGNLARSMQARIVRVVVVYSTIPSYLGSPNMQTVMDARLKEAHEILDAALAELGSFPGEVHIELIEGSPAEAIINVADTRKSDLIVMGSRGLGTLTGLLLGSTSQKVVSHAPCPVLIAR
jgi:nucleotide-binding universal stress UspA family protein